MASRLWFHIPSNHPSTLFLIKTYVNWKPVGLRFEGNSYFYSSRLFSIDFDQLIWWDEFVWILTLGQKLLKQLFSHFYLIPTQDFFGIQTFPYLMILWLYLLYEVCKTLGFRSSARFESRNDFEVFLKSHYCVFKVWFLKITFPQKLLLD